MTELAKIEPGDGLSELQRRFVELLLSGVEPDDAKGQAGYSSTTPTVSVLRGKLVQNAISEACAARLKGDLRLKALSTLETLLTSGPAATRFNAAKLILEQAEEGEEGEEKALSSMTIEELEAIIKRREAELKDVTPKNGA